MNVFQTHAEIVDDYATYIRSLLKIEDRAIRYTVEEALSHPSLFGNVKPLKNPPHI